MKTKIKTLGEFIAVLTLMGVAVTVATSFALPVAEAAILSEGDSFSSIDQATGGQRSLIGYIQTVVNTLLRYLGIVAVALICFYGFQYMTAEDKEGPKKGLIYVGVGLLVILGSYVIVNAIIGVGGGVAA